MTPGIAAAKHALRRAMMAKRNALPAAVRAEAAQALVERALQVLPVHGTISAFWPMGSEIDTRPVLRTLHARGHAVLLPRMQGRGLPLVFYPWSPGNVLEPGPFGVEQPRADGAPVVPDVCLVPLLAFDSQGYRLGYGGGFYDRTFAAWQADGHEVTRVGLAYSEQEVEAVPHEAFDMPLHAVLTELGLRRLGAG